MNRVLLPNNLLLLQVCILGFLNVSTYFFFTDLDNTQAQPDNTLGEASTRQSGRQFSQLNHSAWDAASLHSLPNLIGGSEDGESYEFGTPDSNLRARG